MINVQNLTKKYGSVDAVQKVSFSVKKGETLILLGTSGCGKTTTLRMLNRLIEPSEGTIELNGKDISLLHPEKLRRGIGYVLQDNGLFPHYTVAENMAIVPKLLKWDKERIKKRTIELLEKLHLPPPQFLNSYPSRLSGGQQQRVGLGRALMANPPVLLMDEPLGSLDPVTRASIRKEFLELDELKEKTIVMVTHDILEAFELGNRICLMDKGEIVQIGTPYQLLIDPVNDFVKGFFQDQRLQLELKVLKLSDVWDYLPDYVPSTTEKIWSSHVDIWAALNILPDTLSGRICIENTKHSDIKTAGYHELMIAYSEYKNSLI